MNFDIPFAKFMVIGSDCKDFTIILKLHASAGIQAKESTRR
jgi:hypothetical protein